MNTMLLNPNLGLLLMRLMVGVVGVYHGSQKLFGAFGGKGPRAFAEALEKMNVPMPKVSAVLAGSAECFGGILVAIGLFPRLAALPGAFAMYVAFFVAHKGVFPQDKGGGEYALTLAVVLTGLFFTGPGQWTVMRLISAGKGGGKAGTAPSH